MKIGTHEFQHVCDIEPQRAPDGSVTAVMPQSRYKGAETALLNRYGAGPFCKFKIPTRFSLSGVYVLTVNHTPLYVGECANLSARFNAGYGNISPKNCFKGGQETNCRVNSLVYAAACRGERLSLWFMPTSDYKVIESQLRTALRLGWNRI